MYLFHQADDARRDLGGGLDHVPDGHQAAQALGTGPVGVGADVDEPRQQGGELGLAQSGGGAYADADVIAVEAAHERVLDACEVLREGRGPP